MIEYKENSSPNDSRYDVIVIYRCSNICSNRLLVALAKQIIDIVDLKTVSVFVCKGVEL